MASPEQARARALLVLRIVKHSAWICPLVLFGLGLTVLKDQLGLIIILAPVLAMSEVISYLFLRKAMMQQGLIDPPSKSTSQSKQL